MSAWFVRRRNVGPALGLLTAALALCWAIGCSSPALAQTVLRTKGVEVTVPAGWKSVNVRSISNKELTALLAAERRVKGKANDDAEFAVLVTKRLSTDFAGKDLRTASRMALDRLTRGRSDVREKSVVDIAGMTGAYYKRTEKVLYVDRLFTEVKQVWAFPRGRQFYLVMAWSTEGAGLSNSEIRTMVRTIKLQPR